MIKCRCFLLIFFLLAEGKVFSQLPAQTLPDFEFNRLDKSKFSNKDLPRGKMLFFVFFDSDCEHCQQAVKNIDQHADSFSRAAVYLVSADGTDKISHFINNFGQHLKSKKNVLVLQDNLNQFIAKFKPRKYPSMFLYSKERQLAGYEDNQASVFRFFKEIAGW